MSNKPESFWRPQVLRHRTFNATEEFAIHEVHFSNFGSEWGPTEDAASSRYPSVKDLRVALEGFVASNAKSMHCGDRNYEYFREDIELWLEHISDPVLEYPSV